MPPISVDEIDDRKAASIPKEIYDVFDAEILKNFYNGSATVKQKDVIYQIVNSMVIDRSTVFANHWLDVEHAYRRAGWKVQYDKPGYSESYDAYWVFSKN